jgi:hypothetical protein
MTRPTPLGCTFSRIESVNRQTAPRARTLSKAFAAQPVQGHLTRHSQLPDDEFPNAQADRILFASLNEGFGLPLQSNGVRHARRNERGDFPPRSLRRRRLPCRTHRPERIFEAVRRVLTEPDIATELRTRGKVQARKFTWRECAKRTLLAYRNATENPDKVPEPSGRRRRDPRSSARLRLAAHRLPEFVDVLALSGDGAD